MNAPLFDTANLKSPYGSAAWVREFYAEETRCCKSIDARTCKLEEEDSVLLKESIALEKQIEAECGFFARLKLTLKMRKIDKEREWRRLALIELYEARLRRTMTW